MSLSPYSSGTTSCRTLVRRAYPHMRNLSILVPLSSAEGANAGTVRYVNPFNKEFEISKLVTDEDELSVEEQPTILYDEKHFQVTVGVYHFAPNEIRVKVIDGFVEVMAKHNEKKDEHGFVSRQFKRRFLLPEGCLPDLVESKHTSDGVLVITAPRILPMPSSGERIVPIQHTGPVRKYVRDSY